jgi:hypothetical protein
MVLVSWSPGGLVSCSQVLGWGVGDSRLGQARVAVGCSRTYNQGAHRISKEQAPKGYESQALNITIRTQPRLSSSILRMPQKNIHVYTQRVADTPYSIKHMPDTAHSSAAQPCKQQRYICSGMVQPQTTSLAWLPGCGSHSTRWSS